MATDSPTDRLLIDSVKPGGSAYRLQWKGALAGGLVAGTIALLRWKHLPSMESDLDQLWHAARAVLSAENPYEAVGPGKPFEWEWGLLYPLPAIILVTPLTVLPVAVARFVFSVLAGATLGFAMGARWRALWPLFLSQAFFLTISRNQWSAFMLAAIWMPSLGFMIAAKPNIGLVALAAQGRETVLRVCLLAVALIATSFLVRPSWFGEWLTIVRSATHMQITLLQPGGFVLLAGIVLWRTTEGRLLLAASVVPQTPSVYDALLLFAVCQTRTQAAFLALLTHVAQITVLQLGPYANHDTYYDSMTKVVVWVIMIPALVNALMNRPTTRGNIGEPAASKRTSAFANPIEMLLIFVLFVAFLLQLWIIYG